MVDNMRAVLVQRSRADLREGAFVEIVIWLLPRPVPGSRHSYKYRLALVIDDRCVLRYDNQRGKGDHKHLGDVEFPVEFTSMDDLLDMFEHDLRRLLE